VRTTLDIDDDVVAAARELAAGERRSLGSVISELARRGLTPARVEVEGDLPVIRVPQGTPPITPEIVRRAPKKAEAPVGLLDVNALVALAWDSHIHHAATRDWFAANSADGWATCPLTESGFVRVSSNPPVLPSAIGVEEARGVVALLRAIGNHRFLVDDVSMTDDDVPPLVGHRQVSDAHLLTLARRHGVRVITFDGGVHALGGRDVELLTSL